MTEPASGQEQRILIERGRRDPLVRFFSDEIVVDQFSLDGLFSCGGWTDGPVQVVDFVEVQRRRPSSTWAGSCSYIPCSWSSQKATPGLSGSSPFARFIEGAKATRTDSAGPTGMTRRFNLLVPRYAPHGPARGAYSGLTELPRTPTANRLGKVPGASICR